MVYRGKPSRSCLNCRRRKIKCDLSPDSCGQCLRARLACAGYRDVTQLRIQDESQAVKEKAITSRHVEKRFSTRHGTLPYVLDISIDDQARNVFFLHYVSSGSKTYDVLQWLYNPADGHLIASLDAVSLAFFGFQFYHPKANLIARQKYPAALRSLNKALHSPETVKSDSTLLAVLLLDLFEKITNKDAGFSESWMSHIIGALALVKLRGSESLTSYTGTRLSVKLVTNLIISCVSASLEPPPELVKIRSDLESIVTTDGPKWRVTCLMIQYAGLRAAILRNALSDADVILEATRLDYEYEFLAQSMPPAWQYKRICLEGPSEKVLEQHFDVYPDHYICQVWNILRLTRIMLNDLIRKYYDRVMSRNPKGFSYNHKADVATITIDAISLDICASVPQFTQAQLAESSDSLTPALQHARCYTVLFPLYAAGSFSSPSTKIRQWAIQQLEYFSTDFGIRNSGLVAEYLKTAPETCPWTIYGMLGSYAFAA